MPKCFCSLPKDKLLGQVDAWNDLDMSNDLELHIDIGNTESLVSIMDAQKVMGNTDDLHKHLVRENESVQYAHTDSRPIEEPGNDIDRAMNVNENESHTSALEEEARVDTSGRQQTDQEQQPERLVHHLKLVLEGAKELR